MNTIRTILYLILLLPMLLTPAQGLITKTAVPGFQPNGQAKLRRNVTILLTGDSLMESLGPQLKRSLAGYQGLTVIPIGKKSTGLSRPDFYNWPLVLEQHLKQDAPDVVVMWVGTNDPQNIHGMTGLGAPCSKEWQRAYLRKLKEIIALVYKYKARLVFMGPPVMDTEPLNTQLNDINRLMAWVSGKTGVYFIDTRAILADSQGRYLQRAQIGGKMEELRTHDHVHITAVGNQLVMNQLLPVLSAACSGVAPPRTLQSTKKGSGAVKLRYP